MSKLETNTIDTISGTNTLTLGSSNLSTINMASGVSPGTGMGKILQVVSVVDSTEVIVNNQTYTDTGLTANITPISTSSKVLVMVNHSYLSSSTNTTHFAGIKLLRGSTDIFDPQATNSTGPFGIGINLAGSHYSHFPMQFLDSPNSTSQQTYKTQCRNYTSTTTFRVNPSAASNNGESVMTLMEVSA